MSYSFKNIEQKWQNYWKENQCFRAHENSNKPKAYILEMLPYPSGRIHMGHVRNYTLGDAIARYKVALGFNVLHPMGWDAFGLPAENAAIERNVHPGIWTNQNIKDMKAQLSSLGFSFDWDKEINSCAPDYYGKEQEIFLDFYEKGLVYRKESWVNWDPIEQTVLANEQVVDGKGWRSGALVEKKLLNQWSLKITHYAQELLDDLKNLSGWPEKVIKMQENWIGRSEGALIKFALSELGEIVEIYTTRPETIFGCSFLALSAQHDIVKKLAEKNNKIQDFIDECNRMATTEEAVSTMDKKGIDLGVFAEHPISGVKVPVFAANFVLMEYGTGALFGCPAHDARDYEFATKYNLPITQVVDAVTHGLPIVGDKGIIKNSGFLDGLDVAVAKEKMINYLEDKGIGARKVQYRLRDWLVSRQRYWGCPIPIIYCNDCGEVPVPKSQLPVLLPDDVSFDKRGNPLDHHPSWKHINCPKCNKAAKRETDTLDTFFESSWYFMRYCTPHAEKPIDNKVVESWLPVDQYIGGIEHAVLHLLYARFFTKAMRDCGYAKIDEPFKNLMTQGMVCHVTYQDAENKWLYPHEVEKSGGGYIKIEDGSPVKIGRQEKMSKSRKNTIDPQSIIESYGADVARLFILSDNPPEKDFDWNDDGLDGSWRYLNRVYRLADNIRQFAFKDSAKDESLRKITHQYLHKITYSYDDFAFNKVLSYARELTRAIEENYQECSSNCVKEVLMILIKVLNPIAPHLAHEIWGWFNTDEYLDAMPWPVIDIKMLEEDQANIVVQVNGKLRGTLKMNKGTAEEAIKAAALEIQAVKNAVADKEIKKFIVVPNKLINMVVA